jgi:hypothetical protein
MGGSAGCKAEVQAVCELRAGGNEAGWRAVGEEKDTADAGGGFLRRKKEKGREAQERDLWSVKVPILGPFAIPWVEGCNPAGVPFMVPDWCPNRVLFGQRLNQADDPPRERQSDYLLGR